MYSREQYFILVSSLLPHFVLKRWLPSMLYSEQKLFTGKYVSLIACFCFK